MQHHPGAILLVEAELDEMIAAAQRAELVYPARLLAGAFLDARMALQDPRQGLLEALGRIRARITIVVALETDGNVARDLVEHLAQRSLVHLVAGERQPARDHAAADVDAHGRRND